MKIIVCYKHTKTITYIIYKSNHFHHIETLDLILAGILGCCHFSNILPIHPSHQVVATILWYIHPCFRDHPLHSDSFHLPSIFSWLRSLFDRPGETKHDLGGPEQRRQAPGGFPLHQWSYRRIDPQQKKSL